MWNKIQRIYIGTDLVRPKKVQTFDFQNNWSLNWTATTIGYWTPSFVTGQGWTLYRGNDDRQAGIMPPSSVYTGELKKIKIYFYKWKWTGTAYGAAAWISDKTFSANWNNFLWSFSGVAYDNIRYWYSWGNQRIQTANFTGEATIEADFSNANPVVTINWTSYTLTNGDSSVYKGYWTSWTLQIWLWIWGSQSWELYVRKVEITTVG